MKNKRNEYLKITDRSGCISGSFKERGRDSEVLIIPIEERELSGRFKPYTSK